MNVVPGLGPSTEAPGPTDADREIVALARLVVLCMLTYVSACLVVESTERCMQLL